MGEIINILIRTMPSRAEKLANCINSIESQTYRKYRIHTYYDESSNKTPYHYNLFCNDMKAAINDGWFFFLDDDDMLNSPDALQQVAQELTNTKQAVICQFKRGEHKLKPTGGDIRNRVIRSGGVGMPCLILHHSQKHIADIPAEDNGDYLWIKSVCEKLPVKFVEKILVNSPKRNYGQ